MSRVKGWCPSAHQPMMSGDGLLVRVKPRMGRLSAAEVLVLCDLAGRFGNGMIDVTSRANLQIRGVSEADHPALLAGLIEAGLVDADARREGRNTVITPFWRPGDLTERLYAALEPVTAALPSLPDKMGIALDTGPAPMLQGVSGDFRFETSVDGQLILRADGAKMGLPIDEATAGEALAEMVDWFLATGGAEGGRMGRHLKKVQLPEEWEVVKLAPSAGRPGPGGAIGGRIYGVPFGQSDAASLTTLVRESEATHLRVTPWRTVLLEDAKAVEVPGYLATWDNLMRVSACPGAPTCTSASVETRDLARRLAGRTKGTLHVSGCVKGCARQAAADVTIVGRDGRFDLVRYGRAGDTPERSGLTEPEILALVG